MENNKKSRIEAAKYEDLVFGLNLTPEQDKELRKLYRRSVIPGRPWGFIFAGGVIGDWFLGLHVLAKCVETNDINAGNWYFAFLGAQIVALLAWVPRMVNADQKLHNRIDQIRDEYLRQISR